MGRARIEPLGAVEAGGFASFTLTYTAGYFGIDDTGSLKIVFRFASDMGRPQFTDPKAPGYTTVEASNGAVLEVAYDPKRNIRPWDKTLFIRVMRGFLREGDRIAVRFGDRSKGSPGIRMQTMAEPTFEFRVLVDPFATYSYCELPESPHVPVVAGPPAKWVAVLPSLRRAGEHFRLSLKAEDKWGNPTDKANTRLHFKPSSPVGNLAKTLDWKPGRRAAVLEDLHVDQPGDLVIEVLDEAGKTLCASNPLRIAAKAELLPFWCDLHGQSEETIGTNSAEEYFAFARDLGFLDAISHQGNDFQITTPFWRRLNELSARYNRDHRFIAFPGFEWSGNTGLGGDRNVLFMKEGRQIHRSSHALVDDLSDVGTDANSAEELFRALKGEDCLVFAHIGGRYADIKMAHDIRLERSVEVHSDWGTFEWLLGDALEQGYRVGILANSDGHKGRPGASYPGASLFGAYGGLSCVLAKELTRPALMEALRRRHHYATTGCRMHLDVRARFDGPAEGFEDDPRLGPTRAYAVREAIMGDIVRSDREVTLQVEAIGSAPIERMEIRNRMEVLETVRPYGQSDLGGRIRVIWEGSEYRGRGRQTVWDGEARLAGNGFAHVRPVNFYNLDKQVTRRDASRVSWQALTTGGFGGFDAWLDDPSAGTLAIDTKLVKAEIPVASIGLEDRVFATGGGIKRQIRVFRLPDENRQRRLKLERRLKPTRGRDDAYYVCITQEDGHLIWSSPIYVI
jgi:predicted DNA-binding protein